MPKLFEIGSCRRGSRVGKKPSKVEVVKREHKNVGPRMSSHNACLKDVRGELPIGSVARKTAEGSVHVRLECRTREVKICKAALRQPWIHIPRTVLRSGTCGGAAPNVVATELQWLFSHLSW